MALGRRLHLSLVVRMLVSLGIITAVSATIILVGAAVAGEMVVVGLAVVGYLVWLLPFPADGALGSVLSGFTATEAVTVPLLIGVGLLPTLYLGAVRDEIREFKTELGTTGQLAIDRHPTIASIARRLAQQADIPEPTVRIVTRSRPESYALGGRTDGTIVLTRGLVRELTDSEIEAVVAHEISHLVNGDGRLMNFLLVPLLLAEDIGATERPKFELVHAWSGMIFVYIGRLLAWRVVTAVTAVQQWCCLLGIALLSRGRELAADRGAAELTGSPSTVASALETLDGGRGRPNEDLRAFKRSAGALDILPPQDQTDLSSPFRTHPSTETRIERLEALVPKIET